MTTLPMLLLVPGLLNTPAVFDRLRAQLPPQQPVRVATVHTQDSLAAMADDAWQQVADLPPGQPLVLAGFSMGGYVALQMLAAPRRAVQGLALLNTSARADTPETTVQREKAIAAMARDFDRFVNGLCAFALTPAGQADAALLAEVRAVMHAVGPAAATAQTRALMARPDRRAMLPGLRLACQVVGAADDAITPPAWSQELAELIPGASLTLLPGVGHMAPLERPAEVAAALQALLQRVAAVA